MTDIQNKVNSELMEDIYAPTKDEFGLIGNHVFVLKLKPGNVVVSSYHQWRDIWADKMYFKVIGENPDASYRAIALTIPLHLGYPNDQSQIPYSGYVSGIHPLGGDVRVTRLSSIEWSAAPSTASFIHKGDTSDRACDPSQMNGCNSQ